MDAASVELSEAIDALITRAVKARADAEAEERARAEAALAAQLQAAADEAVRPAGGCCHPPPLSLVAPALLAFVE